MKNYVKYTKFFKEVALSKKWEKQGLKHIHFQQCLFMEQTRKVYSDLFGLSQVSFRTEGRLKICFIMMINQS